MCYLVRMAVPRLVVPMLVYAAYPRIESRIGCVTSCKNMVSISCLRMKFSSIAILVGDARPFMLRVAILKTPAIGLRVNRGFPGVYRDA